VRFKFWFVFDFVSPSAVKIRQKWLRLFEFDFEFGLVRGFFVAVVAVNLIQARHKRRTKMS